MCIYMHTFAGRFNEIGEIEIQGGFYGTLEDF